MHETGIADEILRRAEGILAGHPGARIETVHVRIGDLSGVVCEALEFAFECLKPRTAASEASLAIERVPVTARCPLCETVSQPGVDLVLWCGGCEVPLDIISGEELDLVAIDLSSPGIEEEAPCPESLLNLPY
jgi:hydrogenase nickel incorporation protein HypA/HybF